MEGPAQRQRTFTVISVVVTAVLLSGYLTFGEDDTATRVRGLLGGVSRLDPRVTADTEGPYAFMATQPGSEEPVGFSPCRPLEYAVNPAGAPPGWEDDVRRAVAEVERRTGLRLVSVGTTDDRDFDDRSGGRRSAEPALLGWSDAEEIPELDGDVAGLGGATMVEIGGVRGYVSGAVVLDTATTDRLVDERDGHQVHRALLMHELGHLVGLGHVEDRGELMYADGITRVDFGPGDREGLSLLGAIDC